jgi:hypothetical protein
VEVEHGLLINARTRQPFTYGDSCIERGTTVAYDESAAAKARKTVSEIVAAVVKP